ncbi:MAG: stage VI sporulation protein F [Bacilli bacterium]|nr:stage VI sporulation protein F [Bacilli bacterium]MBR1748329.1 stage VI sporulation protein F [Bacilli bacterium]MBR1817531.1 stage VI sporulation protein F [Bacilli bacterium]
MELNDQLFQKVEKKTKVSKETILELAKKIQEGNMKDESTLRSVVQTLSQLTGKEVSKEREDKIIETIIKDKVPKGVEKMF